MGIRLCSSCGSLLQLWGIMFPMCPCMIRNWPLLWCLLWSSGWCMNSFPRLCYSEGYKWTCLGFIRVFQWRGGSLCLWLSVLWFLMILRVCCPLGDLGRVFLVQGWSICGCTSLVVAWAGSIVAIPGRFGGKYFLLVDNISTPWSMLPGSRPKSLCGGWFPWRSGFHRWYGCLTASSPRPFYVVLVGGVRCSVVFFGHV